MKMKKTIGKALISVFLCICLTVIAATFTVSAADEKATMFVTIANGTGVYAADTEVTDIDGDGKLTINDALAAAHISAFEGGATGYSCDDGAYGLYITKLWGVADGAYGYYVNGAPAFSLTDEVKDGDYVDAFIYTDSAAYSDVYCFFEERSVALASGASAELTLMYSGFDESWQSVTLPESGAEIVVDGIKTGILTDADGKATVEINGIGNHVITAVSDLKTLVPPVCTVTASAATPETGDSSSVLVFVALALMLMYASAAVFGKIKSNRA